MYRSDTRPQQDERQWTGSQSRSDDYTGREMEATQRPGSMERGQEDYGQGQSRQWRGYVVPYRYYGQGYRGVGYYSVMYLGPTGSETESQGEFDQRNVDYGQGQGAGAAWSRSKGRDWTTSGGYAGRGPKGYKRSDERIEEEINDRLMADDGIDASEIEVRVRGGEVTLSGTVDDRDAKRRAEDVAESVMGVREVMNQLRLQSSSGSSSSSSSRSRSSQESGGSRSMTGSSSGTSSRRSSRNGSRSSDESTTGGGDRTRTQSSSSSG
ncbi:MAG: BON domain-containing protein [Chloroflexota bacterium]